MSKNKVCSKLFRGGVGDAAGIHANGGYLLLGVGSVAIVRVLVGDLVHHVHTLRHPAESGVSAVQMRSVGVHYEKLTARAVGIHCPRHAYHPALMLQSVGVKAVLTELARYGITGTAHARALRTTSLYHKAANNAMKNKSVVKAAVGERDKIVDCVGRDSRIQLQLDGFAALHSDCGYGVEC